MRFDLISLKYSLYAICNLYQINADKTIAVHLQSHVHCGISQDFPILKMHHSVVICTRIIRQILFNNFFHTHVITSTFCTCCILQKQVDFSVGIVTFLTII